MELLFCYHPNLTGEQQHCLAHRLLHCQLAKHQYRDFTMVYGKFGKPSLKAYPEIEFNLSHTKDLCVSAIGGNQIGVDVEEIRPLRPNVIRRICTEEEKQYIAQAKNSDEAFFRIWTLKESYVKAIGIGVSYPMRTISLRLIGGRIDSNLAGYRFVQYLLWERYIISLCTAAPPEESVRLLGTTTSRLTQLEDMLLIRKD